MSFWPFLVLQVVVVVGALAALRRLLSRNLTDATSRLQNLSADYLNRQEELKQRMSESERQYQERIARAKVEAEQLVAEARQEAEASRTKTLEQAHREGERIVQQAREAAEALRKELDREIEHRAIERACELIQEVLPGQLRETVQSPWLDELIHNGLSQLDAVKADDHLQEVRVVSAFPLNDRQRASLRQWLKHTLGKELPVNETVDERLVAGLTITLGSLVLDGSLSSRVRQAARQAQEGP